MLFRERADRQIRGDQVAVDAGKTVGIQVFQIRRFHVLAEEPAEIFRLQRDNIGSLLQRNRPLVIFLRVRQNRIEPCLRPGAHRVVRKRALLGKFRVEQIEKRKAPAGTSADSRRAFRHEAASSKAEDAGAG